MIVVDLNNVFVANLMVSLGKVSRSDVHDEGLLRHMILSSVLRIKRTYQREYGNDSVGLVLAADGPSSWRKGVFPHYKANRKKDRDSSDLDWSSIHDSFSRIREEFRRVLPYPLVQVEGAEADDVIAHLRRSAHYDRFLIVSGDKDFMQLQTDPRVFQVNPVVKPPASPFMRCEDPVYHLFRHVMKGDTGDGVPNVLSADDCLVSGVRQASVTEKRLSAWWEKWNGSTLPETEPPEVHRNLARNRVLIDLSRTPPQVRTLIDEDLERQRGKDRSLLLAYLADKGMPRLMESINDF